MLDDIAAGGYSAALCRGLIEIPNVKLEDFGYTEGIPRLYAAASLKCQPEVVDVGAAREVFRGFMPRPH